MNAPAAPLFPTSVDRTEHDRFSINPFRAIVRAKVIRAFEALSERDPGPALALMDEQVEYTFAGLSAVGGTRHNRAAVARWFDRLLRLVPGRFELHSVEVAGWPWKARVYVQFEDTVTPLLGEPYRNQGVQVIDLEWGIAKRIHTYVDTAKVEHALKVMVEQGVAEAGAPPIADQL